MVLEFINGIVEGVSGTRREGAVARPRRIAHAPAVPSPLERTWRFAILIIGALAAGLTIYASLRRPTPPPKHEKSLLVAPSVSNADLHTILQIDPDAHARAWRYIVIHHSASYRGSAQSFDQYHRQKGWAGLGYHFVIGNGVDQADGGIVAGPRWYAQDAGAHANSAMYNEHGIGICLVGNFEQQPPTPAQLAALTALIKRLVSAYDIPPEQIVGHNQIRRGGGTACPGKHFPMAELREAVR